MLPPALIAQPGIDWVNHYGGENGDMVWSHKAVPTGGFILAGESGSNNNGESDMILVRVADDGEQQWLRYYGGDDSERCFDVINTSDNGFLLVGYSRSFGEGQTDWYVIKTDSSGDPEWSRTYGGENFDECFSAIENQEGYSLAGFTWSFGAGQKDFYLMQIDRRGQVVWEETYGTEDFEFCRNHVTTVDGGYALTGYSIDPVDHSKDIWLVITDSEGNMDTETSFGGRFNDDAYGMIRTSDDSYLMVGYSIEEEDGDSDGFAVRTSADGDLVWEKTYGGDRDDIFQSVTEAEAGGYLLVGSTYSFGEGLMDGYMVRIDQDGNEIWSTTFGGNQTDEFLSAVATQSGYSLAGESISGFESNDCWLVQSDADPVIEFSIRLVSGWNLISAPMIPLRPEMVDVWRELVEDDNLKMVKDQRGNFYWPAMNFNNIPDWRVEQGYYVNIRQDDSLKILNQPVEPDTPIVMDAGWSIVSYYPDSPSSAEVALRNIQNVILLAKNGAGQFYAPEFEFSNMPVLSRGNGYHLLLSRSAELTWQIEE